MRENDPQTRLAPARRRVTVTKRALAIAAVVGFAGSLLLARATHPGTAATPSQASPTSSAGDSATGGEDFFSGGAAIEPGNDFGSSGAPPDVRTSVS
jgi:hypothetical protein